MKNRIDSNLDFVNQSGGGMLSIVAVLGLVLMLVQGSVYYRAKESTKFLAKEKNKVLAMQMAEAGVEENIADIGNRTTRVRSGMSETTTYYSRILGSGTFTSTLTPVAMGAEADTVDLSSTGSVGTGTQSVQARLRLKKYLDSTLTPIVTVTPDTTVAFVSTTVPETTSTTTILDPASMPSLNATPAYTACFASSAHKCDVCHLPGGNVSNAHVINIAKPSIGTHVSHHGDYVTTDGTCDLYMPKTVNVYSTQTVIDTVVTVTDLSTYDTTMVVDTVVKVQILSWK